MPTMRERIANFVAGRKNPETGTRQGGVAGLFRGGNGQMMLNPISALGDRIGRGVQRRLIDRRINRDNAESDQRRMDMIASDDPGRPVMATRGMPGPADIQNPSDGTVGRNDSQASIGPRRQMTPEEIQQQREQFDRYRNDSNSIYYQGPRAGDPMPGEIVGPNAHTFRNPTRELYDASQIRTGSGDSFRDAVAHYRSLQKPNRNIAQ